LSASKSCGKSPSTPFHTLHLPGIFFKESLSITALLLILIGACCIGHKPSKLEVQGSSDCVYTFNPYANTTKSIVTFPCTVLTPVMLKFNVPSSGVKSTSNSDALKLLLLWHDARDLDSSMRSEATRGVSASSVDIDAVKENFMLRCLQW
jgi:hypothetical protein